MRMEKPSSAISQLLEEVPLGSPPVLGSPDGVSVGCGVEVAGSAVGEGLGVAVAGTIEGDGVGAGEGVSVAGTTDGEGVGGSVDVGVGEGVG
ncbi:MAG TPA: hypothetical protein VIP09_01155, partial [Dehalococcoidia bacterium]